MILPDRAFTLAVIHDEDDEGCPCKGNEPGDDAVRVFAVFVMNKVAEWEHGEYAPCEFEQVESFFRNAPLAFDGFVLVNHQEGRTDEIDDEKVDYGNFEQHYSSSKRSGRNRRVRSSDCWCCHSSTLA